MQKISNYKMSTGVGSREQLRAKGQFWTPDWIAEAMVEYALADHADLLFDPAVGAGAFFRAAKKVASERGLYIIFSGMENDSSVLEQAVQFGLDEDDIAGVKIGDFLFEPPQTKFSAVVGNPPYIRHHRIPALNKAQLKNLGSQTIGQVLDGRAGLHVYFLIQALTLLDENGRLAFIMPADICEGKFAYDLWNWITANFALDAVVTFAPEASPFPNVDTNPIIFFIRKSKRRDNFLWIKCYKSQTESLKSLIQSSFSYVPEHGLNAIQRNLSEGLSTGLSRPPVTQKMSKYVLGDFCYVLRGVATGANEFFFMTEAQVNQLGIPYNYFVRAVGRTRDVPGNEITKSTLESLRAQGRPTLLLSLNGENFEDYPEPLKSYLRRGEALGLPKRPLISQRDPWYKMETRIPPTFLFAYLG